MAAWPVGIARFHHRLPTFRRHRSVGEALGAVELILNVRDCQRDREPVLVGRGARAVLGENSGCDPDGFPLGIRFAKPRLQQVSLDSLLYFGFVSGRWRSDRGRRIERVRRDELLNRHGNRNLSL